MQNKIIILGSNGYLGSNLYCFLKLKEYNVIGVARVPGDSSDLILEDYFLNFHKLKSILKPYDIVINCLNDLNIRKKNKDFINFFHNNINIKIKFIQISSLSVYYSDIKNDFNENSILNPKSRYGKIKLNNEQKIINFNNFENFLIFRVGGIYGKGRIPIIFKFKQNLILRQMLKVIFHNLNLKLISVNNFNRLLEHYIKYDRLNNDIMNIFYEHRIIHSKKNFISIFLKNTFFKKYYLQIDNSKFKEIKYDK